MEPQTRCRGAYSLTRSRINRTHGNNGYGAIKEASACNMDKDGKELSQSVPRAKSSTLQPHCIYRVDSNTLLQDFIGYANQS